MRRSVQCTRNPRSTSRSRRRRRRSGTAARRGAPARAAPPAAPRPPTRSRSSSVSATSLSTRTSSLGRPAASGAECQSANAARRPSRRTRLVSPIRSSWVSASSRVKSMPGASRSVSARHSARPSDSRAPGCGEQLAGIGVAAADVPHQRDGQVARHEAEPAVEADVVHRARHRLEPDGARPLGPEPVDPRLHHRGPEPLVLPVGPHRERPHPPFGARPVHHVEAGELPVGVAPDHGAVAGVLDGVAPDRPD